MCLAGGFRWQDGATDLPAPKKSLEWPATAVVAWVGFLDTRLFQAARADVTQGDLVSGLAHLVCSLLGASFLFIESNTDILRFHVCCRGAVYFRDGGLPVGVASEPGAAAALAGLLGHATGALGALLESNRLRHSMVVRQWMTTSRTTHESDHPNVRICHAMLIFKQHFY